DRFGFFSVRFLDASAPAGGVAATIAGAPEYAGKHVGIAIQQIRVVVAGGGDQADVLGHPGVRRARPLAVHHLVEILQVADVGRLHATLLPSAGASDLPASPVGASLTVSPQSGRGIDRVVQLQESISNDVVV